MTKWIVVTKGGPNKPSFEISVEREGRDMKDSYGWFGEDKLLISHNGGPCRWPVTEAVWKRLVRIAREEAVVLNAKERYEIS